MQEQFSRMKETYEGDIRKIREDKTRLEIEAASLDKVRSHDTICHLLMQVTVDECLMNKSERSYHCDFDASSTLNFEQKNELCILNIEFCTKKLIC